MRQSVNRAVAYLVCFRQVNLGYRVTQPVLFEWRQEGILSILVVGSVTQLETEVSRCSLTSTPAPPVSLRLIRLTIETLH
jgi:hypothetical protein